MEHLSKEFWSDRYKSNTTGWDLGSASPPIKDYFDQVKHHDAEILIPGCGNGHEAEYLFDSGFVNTHVVDLAAEPLNNLKDRCPDFPEAHMHVGDFFEHQGAYDFIVEQTLFCAINPTLRQQYADKVFELLKPGGKLVGVLFDTEFDGGPPYGGCKDEYLKYFNKFSSVSMEPCHNSVQPRHGRELFILIVK